MCKSTWSDASLSIKLAHRKDGLGYDESPGQPKLILLFWLWNLVIRKFVFWVSDQEELTIPDWYFRSASHLMSGQTKINLHSFHTRSNVTKYSQVATYMYIFLSWIFIIFDWSEYSLTVYQCRLLIILANSLDPNCFDILIVFIKINFEKKSADDKNLEKLPSMQ